MRKQKASTFPMVTPNMTDEEIEKAVNETVSVISKNKNDLDAIFSSFDNSVKEFDKVIEPSGKKMDTMDPEKIDKFAEDNDFDEQTMRAGDGYFDELENKERKKNAKKSGNVKSAVSRSKIKI